MSERFSGLVEKARELGALDAKIVKVSDLVFDPRSTLKCRFGCDRYGHFWTCPPHVNITDEQFRSALDKYSLALIIKTEEPHIGQEVTVALEKAAMLDHGAMFAFGLALCVWCEECAYPDPCRFPGMARPTMDCFGVDVEKTVTPLGMSVEFDKQGKLLPSWYCMVLLD
jgi:predicted metal-binding protein